MWASNPEGRRMDKRLQQYRYFLKDSIRKTINFSTTDQSRGVPPPPLSKPCPSDVARISLVPRDGLDSVPAVPLLTAIGRRCSHRSFLDSPLTLAELSFLLWCTQGVKEVLGPHATLRTVPSAGARHALETYVYIRRVGSLDEGIYRYLPLEHELCCERAQPGLGRQVSEACFGQEFAGEAAATFIWTTIPYRMEWRYGLAAHKVIAIDAGHVCQNLYLACEAIGAGTCAIGAYDQEKVDSLLGVDGEEEFTVYIAPVGKH